MIFKKIAAAVRPGFLPSNPEGLAKLNKAKLPYDVDVLHQMPAYFSG